MTRGLTFENFYLGKGEHPVTFGASVHQQQHGDYAFALIANWRCQDFFGFFYSVLQCVAVCCSVLQCVAVCCSVLQCVAVYEGVVCRSQYMKLLWGGYGQ